MEKTTFNTLLMTHGPDSGQSFRLTKASTAIGRGPENLININDDEVSRLHCTITIDSGQAILIDNGSSNGTFVNGRPVQRFPLQPGDRIQLGRTQFVFDGFLEIADTPDLSELSSTLMQSESETLPIESTSVSDNDSKSSVFDSQLDESHAEHRFVRTHNDLRFIYDASLTTSRSIDTPKMLGELLNLIFDWVHADRGCVLLTDNNGEDFTQAVTKSQTSFEGSPEFPVNQEIVNYVCKQKVGIMSPNPSADKRWRLENPPQDPLIGEVLCVPIQGHAKLLGVIYVDTVVDSRIKQSIWFNEDHLRLMLAIAHQAAVAIENKSYFSALIEKERMTAVGETTALMSHQINNILQGINGGSHLVEMGLAKNDAEMSEKGWRIVRRNQDQISQLLMDLVFLSKPFEPQKKKTDLPSLLSIAIEQYHSNCDSQPMTCRVHCDSTDSEVSVDADSFVIAITNLLKAIDQAIQSESKRSCEVDIVVSKFDAKIDFRYQGAQICVKPSGDLEMLLEREHQPVGGIDFEVCQKIARGHGGAIVTSSESRHSHKISMTFKR